MPKVKYSKTYLGVAYSLLLVTPKVLEDHIDRHRGGFICTIRNFKEPFKEKLDQEQLKLVEDLIALSENNLCRYYDQIKDNTVLDKSFLDIMISKLVMTKEDREEVSKHRRQSDRNKTILDILIRKPKYKWKDFLKALKDSEETNHKLASQLEQQVMFKESQLEQHDMLKESQIGKPLTDICKYKTKVQKNYDKLVTQIQSTALEAIIDKLIEQNVVSSDDREEIKMCNSTSDMIRLLLQKINNESQGMTFVQALRADEVYNSLADAIESTEITDEDILSIKQACPYAQYKSSFDASTTITLLSVIFEAEIPVTTPLREDVSFGADLYRLKSYITDIINKDDIDDDTMTKTFLDITKILVRLGGPDIEHNLATDLVNVEQKLIDTLTKLKEIFTKELFDVKVIEGCNADFEIWTKQNTVCTKWFKDGSEISISDRFQIHSSNCGKIHSLKICNTDLSDKGVYTVRVQDVERRARLEVIEYFTKTANMNIECTEGENADLSFEVLDGNVSVVWKKGGYEIKNSEKYEINDHGKTHSLSIKKTELDDAGNYLIQVNNRTRMTLLFIKEYFSINLKNRECLEGDDICFECEIPDENMIARWFKDDDEVETSTRYKMQSQGRRHKLHIINVRLTDAGEYCALIKNCQRKCSLTVREKSKNILSEQDKSLYLDIIKSKQETRFYIRIIIIGENGVGKTCLVRRLLKLGTDNVKSTDGIDIYRCRIQDGKWVYDKGTDKRKQLITRMKQSINVQNPEHDYPVMDKGIERKGGQDSSYNNLKKTQPMDSPNSSTHSQMDSPNSSTHSQMDSSDRSTNSQMDSTNISTHSQMQSSKSDHQTTADNLNAEIRQSKLENKTIVEDEEANTESPKLNIIDSILNDNIVQELSIFLDDIENSEVTDEVLVDCGFWDFAGQREYYPTHPIFLNPHALHLLVANITKDIEPIKAEKGFYQIGEYLDFWFDSVHSLRDTETDDNEKLNPPVILVCTNIDKCKDIGDVNKLEKRTETFRRQVLKILGDEKVKHLRHICRISNTESTQEEFDDLRKLIFEFGKEMKTYGEKLPLKFIRLERALDIVRETGVNILSSGDIKTLAYKCSFYNENEIKLFLEYQHKIGNIIYFETLHEIIILNQKWLADAFRCLVSVRFDEAVKLTPAWKRLEETGELSENLIAKLLQKESKLDLNKNRQHILEVMEMFGIIFKVKPISPNGGKRASPTYYMPSMISSQFSIEDIKREFCASDECTQSPWLCIEFKFMPLDVFNNIMREFISRYSVCSVSRTNQRAIYHGLGVFDLDEFYKLAVYFSKNTIALQIWRWVQIEQTKYKEIVELLRTWILRYQTKYETRQLTYTVKTKCSDGDIHNLGGRKSYKDLFGKEKFYCEDHRKTHWSKDFLETWFHNYSEIVQKNIKAGLPMELSQLSKHDAIVFKDLLKEDSYEHFELRSMLQGEQGTGKSTIARFLAGKEPTTARMSTNGIDLYTGLSFIDDDTEEWIGSKQDIEKEVKESKISVTKTTFFNKSRNVAKKEFHKRNVVPVTIWDFRGQDVFYNTHQTFLCRAVYMLVLDGSRALNEPCNYEQLLPGGAKTQKDYVRFWISTIITYYKRDIPGFPKIMVILTHKDKLKVNEIDARRTEIFSEIERMFAGSPIEQNLVITDKIFVNARNSKDPEMEQIKKSLIYQARRQPAWGQKLPKCFLPLELEIQNLAERGVNLIHIEHMKTINSQQPIRPLTESEFKVFLKFQHSVGKIIYFDEPFLEKHIIITPTYLIDAIKSIITDHQFCKGDKKEEEAWHSMAKTGIILKQTVETIWKQKKYAHFFKFMGYLLGVMTRLDILIEPLRYYFTHHRKPTEFYYVTSMIRTLDTTGYLQQTAFSKRNIAFCFDTSGFIIPPALSFRFISYCLSIWDVKTYGNDNEKMLFHRSAVFTVDPGLDIHIQCEEEQLIVRLVHARNRTLIMKDLASSIRECLSAALHKISQLNIKTSSERTETILSFDVKACCSSSTQPCSIAFQDIGNVWICPQHQIEHSRDLVFSWFTEKGSEECESGCPVENEEFLQQSPNELHLRRLAVEYDIEEVRMLVIPLGLPSPILDKLYCSLLKEETIRFTALYKLLKRKPLTFKDLKKAAEKQNIQTQHTLCKVLRDRYITFDSEPEKWDLITSDKDIDKLAPVVGDNSLSFLVELGLTFQDWEQIEYSQTERDLVKLNRKIMEAWRTNCKVHNIKPTLRTIRQAFENIGISTKNIENILFI